MRLYQTLLLLVFGFTSACYADGASEATLAQCSQVVTTLGTALTAAENASGTGVLAGYCQGCATAIKGATAPDSKCMSDVHLAAMGCLTSYSPQLITIASLIGGLTDLTGLSSSQVCSKAGSTMKTVTGLIAVYNTECGALQMNCSSSCATATDISVSGLETSCSACTPAWTIISKMNSTNMTACVTGCSSFKLQLAVGAVGAVEFLRNMLASNNCNSSTTDCTTVANANTAACYCTNNPTAAGCATAAAATAATMTIPTTTGTGGVSASTTPTAASNFAGGVDGTSPSDVSTPAAASGTASSGAGVGGGAGGGIGGGGGSPAVKTGAEKSAAAGETGGFGSGGGSGGSHGSGGYGDTSSSAYAKFLPTAKKAGTGSAAAAEVSAKAGKSNWDKVSDQYMSLRTGLLGQ